MSTKKSILNNQVFLTLSAIVAGAILGLVFGDKMSDFKFIGDIWLNAIKMIIVPLVFVLITLAVGGQKDLKTLGRTAGKIILLYIISTIIASVVGIILPSILKPGVGVKIEGLEAQEITGTTSFTISTFISSLVSSNISGTFADGNVLQTMVIGILFGIAILFIKDEDSKSFLIKGLNSIRDLIYSYLRMVIKVTPIGVLFLIADSFGKYGFSIFSSMAGLIGTYWLGVIVLIVVYYFPLLWIGAGINPIEFLKKSSPVWTFTIASCSSSATIPISIKTAKDNFGIKPDIVDFSVPLGAQVNYNGSAILYTTVLMFISQMYKIPFDFSTLLRIVLVVTLVAASGGGIPGSGIVKLLVVVQTFNMPVELIGIIAGLYRFFDMGVTTTNCLGTLVGTIFIGKREEKKRIA